MLWLEGDTDRAFLAQAIMISKDAEQVWQGYRRANISGALPGTNFILHHYAHRNIYDPTEGRWVAHETPHYVAQFAYQKIGGTVVNAQINFNTQHSYLHHSTEQTRLRVSENPNETPRIWNEAMSIMDQALYAKASMLGELVLPRMVEGDAEGLILVA